MYSEEIHSWPVLECENCSLLEKKNENINRTKVITTFVVVLCGRIKANLLSYKNTILSITMLLVRAIRHSFRRVCESVR